MLYEVITLLVANEIIIDKKDIPLPAKLIKAVQLGNDLLSRFGAWTVTQQRGDRNNFV